MDLHLLLEPWPWYVSGTLLGILVPFMLWIGSAFGVSGNLDSICGMLGADRITDHFDFDSKERVPGLLFVVGSIVGGAIAGNWLVAADYAVAISEETVAALTSLGITSYNGLLPEQIFNLNSLTSPLGLIMLIGGGFMVGFGARYAGGCTSGHAISGLSNLQVPSLLAVIGFFAGGLVSTFFILPLILHP
ncbi:YeeE/YedE family protein [Bacteroidota bacterium]